MRVCLALAFVFFALCGSARSQDQGANTAQNGGQGEQGGNISGPGIESSDLSGDGLRERGELGGQAQSAFDQSDVSAFGGQGSSSRGSTRSFTTNNGRTTTNRGTANTRTRQVRPSFRLGFVPSQSLTIGNVTARAAQRIARIANTRKRLSGVAVKASQTKGVIALNGTVRSESAKRLAAALLRLEPGVRKVQNNLQVAQAPVAPSAPATPPAPPPIRTRP